MNDNLSDKARLMGRMKDILIEIQDLETAQESLRDRIALLTIEIKELRDAYYKNQFLLRDYEDKGFRNYERTIPDVEEWDPYPERDAPPITG